MTSVGGVLESLDLVKVRTLTLRSQPLELAPNIGRHAGQGELPQVAVLNSRTDKRHGDVSLHPVNPGPRRHEGQH